MAALAGEGAGQRQLHPAAAMAADPERGASPGDASDNKLNPTLYRQFRVLFRFLN